jgi:hypothetical protein
VTVSGNKDVLDVGWFEEEVRQPDDPELDDAAGAFCAALQEPELVTQELGSVPDERERPRSAD